MSEVEENLEKIQDILERAWKFPLTGGKAFVEVDKILQILAEVRESLPREIEQAKKVVADRKKILNDAREESKQMIQSTEEKIKLMLSKDELLKRAKEIAVNLVKEAENKVKEIKKATNSYIENVTDEAVKSLLSGVSNIKNMRSKIKK